MLLLLEGLGQRRPGRGADLRRSHGAIRTTGRSRFWYWRQATGAIGVSLRRALIAEAPSFIAAVPHLYGIEPVPRPRGAIRMTLYSFVGGRVELDASARRSKPGRCVFPSRGVFARRCRGSAQTTRGWAPARQARIAGALSARVSSQGLLPVPRLNRGRQAKAARDAPPLAAGWLRDDGDDTRGRLINERAWQRIRRNRT